MTDAPEPPSLSLWVHVFTLPLLVLLERLAYYGARGTLLPRLIDFGLEMDDASRMFVLMGYGTVFGPLLGCLVAVLFGPYLTALAGTLVCAVAYLLLLTMDGSTAPLALGILVVGQALLRPALWTLVAVQILWGRPHARVALFAACYVAVNIGAAGSMLLGLAADMTAQLRQPYALATALSLGIGLALVFLWLFGRRQTWPTPDLQASLRPLAAATSLLVLVLPFWVLVRVVGFTASATSVALGSNPSTMGQLFAINPLVVTLVTGGLMLFFGISQLLGGRWPALVLAAVAYLASSLGAFGVHPVVASVLGLGGLGVGLVALAAVEGVAIPIAMARMLAGHHWRVVPMLVAAWMTGSGLASMASDRLETALGPELAVPLAAFAVGVCAVIMAAGAVVGRGWLAEESGSEG